MLGKRAGIYNNPPPFDYFVVILSTFSYIIKYLIGMYFGLDFLRTENLLHFALLVDKPGGAKGACAFATAHSLLAPCTEFLKKSGVGVGYQREGKLVFLDEFLMTGC